MGSIISLIIIMTVSILITRIASIALTHTGITSQVAKFQARSAFTGVGFTTNEAETITQHPVRRKIVLTLMLLGNVGIVSAISSLILTFIGNNEGSLPSHISLIIIGTSILILWLLSRSRFIDRILKKIISYALNRYTTLKVKDYNRMLNLSGEYEITEIKVEQDNWIADKKLAELALKDEGIIVLGIKRFDGSFLGIPNEDSETEAGDVLVLYGRENALKSLNERKQGIKGNQEHENAKNKHSHIQEQEEAWDRVRKKK